MRTGMSPTFLSQDEPIQIADLRQGGHSFRRITEKLNRFPSRILRELRRNASHVRARVG
ncbi:helix-turn-helix domain-containing protein [Rhodococcus qingshengii]|uniref:helix-turn-helix domain-containing protein n=1 Tax=Rhodococcus qingshengii TaxID=334542 RepID=UPI003BADBE5C